MNPTPIKRERRTTARRPKIRTKCEINAAGLMSVPMERKKKEEEKKVEEVEEKAEEPVRRRRRARILPRFITHPQEQYTSYDLFGTDSEYEIEMDRQIYDLAAQLDTKINIDKVEKISKKRSLEDYAEDYAIQAFKRMKIN